MSASRAVRTPTRMGALLMVVAAGTCWGLNAVIAKTAFDSGVPPVRMAEARVAVALAVLLVVLAWRRRDLLRLPAGSLPALLGFGLSVALVNAAYYIAIDRLQVGVAVSIQYTAPVILLGVAALTSGRRPAPSAWAAGARTLAGAAQVSRAFQGLHGVSGSGLIAACASALFFATYLFTADRAARRGVHPATVLLWGFVVAIVFWSFASPWWSWPVAKLAHPKVALAVVGVGIVGTLIPFLLAVGAVHVLTPAIAGVAATVEPPAAALFAWVFLGQHLAAPQIAGGVLVLAGVALAQRATAPSPEAVTVEVTP